MRAGPSPKTHRVTVSAAVPGELAAQEHAPTAAPVVAAVAARALRTKAKDPSCHDRVKAQRKLPNGPERERAERTASAAAAAS